MLDVVIGCILATHPERRILELCHGLPLNLLYAAVNPQLQVNVLAQLEKKRQFYKTGSIRGLAKHGL